MTHAEKAARYETMVALRRQGMTLEQIGERYGLTKARVSQILQGLPSPNRKPSGPLRTYSYRFARQFAQTAAQVGGHEAARQMGVPLGSVDYVRKLAEGRV